jgi:hypothetical protein
MHQVKPSMVIGRGDRGMAMANGPALPQHLPDLPLAPRLCQGQPTLLAAMAAVATAPALAAAAVAAAAAAARGRSGRRMLVAGWLESVRGREWQCMQTEAGGWLGTGTNEVLISTPDVLQRCCNGFLQAMQLKLETCVVLSMCIRC